MNGSTGLVNKDSPILQAALGYSRLLKWSVFPLHSVVNGHCTCNNKECTSPGKHPRIYNGLKSATTDKATIINWFTRCPDSNIGIVTGSKNGFFVLDVDPRHKGHESLEQLIYRFGKLPNTVEAITGSKGNHYLLSIRKV
ncbi:bifunctional DNA primase/polymerase [Bacillus sp. ISL-75]|uniref:bifunctional DNA primase/polymerase n=1 Tax=Bacillus sp. ISL-75 TaxID=2819137 RepID=UPI00203541B0|nr:bifunctional DNA primase/polymerase [Bacillus sp. ISL-75]